MAQSRRRPRYTPEFKAEAVRMVRTSPDAIPKIARDLGISAAALRLWVQAAQPAGTPPLTDDERSELRRLRRENRELRMERDILKATAFFAKHLASRRVVGWALRPTLDTRLPLAALHRALARRHDRGWLLHHSDRGVQYASDAYQRVLAAHGLTPSMSRVGNCWDNAPAESCFSRLKVELLPDRPWPTHADAHAAVADHLRFYNDRRLHSPIGYRTPSAFEAEFRAAV
jgi:putative transposase